MSFKLSILAIDREIFEGEAQSLVLPAQEGVIQVLEGHTPLVAVLKEGDLVIERDGKSQVIPIAGGVLEVLQEKVVALVNF